MPSRVRSYSKINLGLAIGPPRPDGFHSLATLYQTVALHDTLIVSARRATTTQINLRSSDPRVPTDERNTIWKMVDKVLTRLNLTAAIEIELRKSLPMQGGMGAGSANAAAALLGLERELGVRLEPAARLAIAAEVGSDVPLFLVGGSVLGSDRGQIVTPVADVTLGGRNQIPCVIALPGIGVSTPLAFREWDRRYEKTDANASSGLHGPPVCDRLEQLGCTYASAFPEGTASTQSGTSGTLSDSRSQGSLSYDLEDSPEKLHGLSRDQRHNRLETEGTSGSNIEFRIDLAENSLLALLRTGIENDFETVVFPQYPALREIKRHLMGSSESTAGGSAVYAALSGSGSALFGLYRTHADANAAQQRLQQHGVKAIVTSTLPRPLYWSNMFAE